MRNLFLNQLLYNQNIKKIANFLLEQPWFIKNQIYRYFLEQRVNKVVKRYGKAPFSLRIENTNVCNARCFMCPHSSMKRRQGFMEKKLYQKIIDEATEMGINFINLHNFGEPFLDKDLVWRIKYAKEKGIKKISTNTNGQTLTEKLAEGLIEVGLDEIFFSIDAASRETYEKIRIGLNYDKVVANIEKLIELKKKNGKENPLITVDFLKSELNEGETKSFINLWQNIVDNICISQIHDWSNKKQQLSSVNYRNYVVFSGVPCRLPFTELLINWDGRASLCCQDVEGEVIIGDANRQSLEEIWQGDKINAIRQRHLFLR